MFPEFRKLLTKIKAPRRCKVSREGVFSFIFTETISFRPFQQGKTHYQLSGIASAENDFRETSPEMNLKTFCETV